MPGLQALVQSCRARQPEQVQQVESMMTELEHMSVLWAEQWHIALLELQVIAVASLHPCPLSVCDVVATAVACWSCAVAASHSNRLTRALSGYAFDIDCIADPIMGLGTLMFIFGDECQHVQPCHADVHLWMSRLNMLTFISKDECKCAKPHHWVRYPFNISIIACQTHVAYV